MGQRKSTHVDVHATLGSQAFCSMLPTHMCTSGGQYALGLPAPLCLVIEWLKSSIDSKLLKFHSTSSLLRRRLHESVSVYAITRSKCEVAL